MPGKPSKGRPGGGFYMMSGSGGRSYGRRTPKELEKNAAFSDKNLQEGQEVTHDFTDSSFDANNAGLPFNVGGGSNWFSRIFNPPSEDAIGANNEYLQSEVKGELANRQTLELEEARRQIDNEIAARTVAPFLGSGQMDALLGPGSGMLNENALGERINAALGPQIRQQGAALAVPQVQLDQRNLSLLNQLAQTPTYQQFHEYQTLSKMHPRVQVGNMVVDPAADPQAGGRIYQGERTMTDVMQNPPRTYPDPKTGEPKIIPGQEPSYTRTEKLVPGRVSTMRQFQGNDAVGYSPEEIDSILRPKGAPQPGKPRNEQVVPSSNQPDASGYIGTEALPRQSAPQRELEWNIGDNLSSEDINQAIRLYRLLKRTGGTLNRHLNPFSPE